MMQLNHFETPGLQAITAVRLNCGTIGRKVPRRSGSLSRSNSSANAKGHFPTVVKSPEQTLLMKITKSHLECQGHRAHPLVGTTMGGCCLPGGKPAGLSFK